MLLSGTVPPLADAYYSREQTGPDLASSLRPGETVVLVHGEETELAPAAQGGTGKTQLAVEFAHAMWNTRAVEVLVWVTGASSESVIAGFAQAANMVDARAPDKGAEMAAARFVAWLARTQRPWALIIDDLAELSDLEELWPTGASGRVLITTRLPATAFEGSTVTGSTVKDGDLRVIPVPGLSRREALDYVASRLTENPDQRIEALDLGEDLDGLPLGLAQATAVMSVRRQGCREYRALLAERIGHMPAVDGVSAAVLATWSIAAECAHELPPAGLAWPTLVLAAMLDHHGVPGAVLTSPAACGYIAGRPSTANGADQNTVRAAINNLAQAGLVTIDPSSPARTVQMHASVQAAVRAYLPPADLEQVVPAAADALLETSPDGEVTGLPSLNRPCGTAPRRCGPPTARCSGSRRLIRCCSAPGCRWSRPGCPARPSRTGSRWWPRAPGCSARPTPAPWWPGTGSPRRMRRPGSPPTPSRCSRPRSPSGSRTRGPSTPIPSRPALTWPMPTSPPACRRHRLVRAHGGRLRADARPGPPGHPGRRASLAETYQTAGRPADAIAAYELLLADAERQLGAGHPATLSARASLGAAYADNGQAKEAIAQYGRALADQERTAGRDHPDTIAARASLASAFRAAGKQKDAIAQYERVLADRERVQGADHPDTIAARANVAYAYRGAGGCARLSRSTSAHPPTARSPGPGPPGHPDRALQPGRLLPASPPDGRRHPAVRARAGRQ